MKKIVIYLSIIICIISTVIIFLKTDLLKTKELLFWKYFIKAKDDLVYVFSNSETDNYNKELKDSYYIKNGNVTITSKNNFVKPINISINEKGNKKLCKNNMDISILYNKKKIEDISIIKDEDLYLVKTNEIDKYIGIENKNLKQLAEMLGIKDTKYIPNKIEEIDYYKLFSIKNEEKNHIMNKYIPICRKFIKNKNYAKQKEDNVTKYSLEISKKEIQSLLIEALNNLYEDDITLEFISKKIEIISKENKYVDIDNLKDEIKNLIVLIEKQEADNEKFLSIIIYKKENGQINAELIIENNRTIYIELNEKCNSIILKQYNVKQNEIDINSIEGIAKTIINNISEISYSKEIQNDNTNNVEFNLICNFGIEQVKVKYNYEEQIKKYIDNIVEKNDVEFTNIKSINKTLIQEIIEKSTLL